DRGTAHHRDRLVPALSRAPGIRPLHHSTTSRRHAHCQTPPQTSPPLGFPPHVVVPRPTLPYRNCVAELRRSCFATLLLVRILRLNLGYTRRRILPIHNGSRADRYRFNDPRHIRH